MPLISLCLHFLPQEHNIEPITGVSSEGYVGKGQVQTDRSSKDLPPLEE